MTVTIDLHYYVEHVFYSQWPLSYLSLENHQMRPLDQDGAERMSNLTDLKLSYIPMILNFSI